MSQSLGKPLIAVALVALISLALSIALQRESSDSQPPASASEHIAFTADEGRGEGEDGGQEEDSRIVLREAAEDLVTRQGAPLHSSEPQEAEGAVRESIQPVVFSALLVDEQGSGIPDARVSWTSYPEDLTGESAWQDLGPWRIGDGWFEEHTVWADSDSSGAFSFFHAPAGLEGDVSVIWVTHLGHQAVPILLETDPETWPSSMRLVMESAPAIRVRVLDGAGEGVQGAAVDELALLPSVKVLYVALETKDAARLFLRRSFVTDRRGYALLPAISGELLLQARSEDALSMPWRGKAKAEVDLRLAPSFTVGGRLTLASGDEIYPGELSVVIDGWKGGFHRQLRRAPLDDGTLTWGPVQVALSGEDQYSFHLKAVTIAPRAVSIPPPARGERVVIDFESTVGEEVWFTLINDDGDTIPVGEVELFFDSVGKYGTVSRGVREDGYIRFVGCPKGHITSIRATAPGYIPLTMRGFEVPEAEPAVTSIPLSPAGRIAGHCLAGRSPIRDFEVIVWPTENRDLTVSKRILGSDDGSFVMDDVPFGELQILAASDSHAPSRPQSVTVIQGELAKVELTLQPARDGEGSVVDDSGAPLPSASVQLLHNNGRKTTTEWGRPIRVDFEGRFQLSNLPPEDVSFLVSAPGFSSQERWSGGQGKPKLDFGVIRLTPLRDLELRFLFPQEVDPTQYVVALGVLSEYSALSSDGTCRFESVHESIEGAWLRSPDGSYCGLKVPGPRGRDWVVEYPMTGTGEIVLDYSLDTYSGSLPGDVRVALDSYARGEDSMVRWRFIAPGENEAGAVFHRVLPGKYLARVVVPGALSLGAVLVTVAAGETAYATITFGEEDSVFQVVDSHDDPIAGVTLSLYDTSYPLWRRTTSDSQGFCTISGSPKMSAFAGLEHSEFGDLWGIPVELGKGANSPIKLEFVAEQSIALRLMDGDSPLRGVTCRLNASDNRNVIVSFPRESDAAGYVTFEKLGAALYGVDLSGPGIWETKIEAEASRNESATTVQVRRLGDLHFQVMSRTDQPQAGAAIELTSLEFGIAAETWIEQGKLRTLPASTLTDSEGILIFPAIPHGSYRWQVTEPSGETLEGIVELPPAGRLVIPVVLP